MEWSGSPNCTPPLFPFCPTIHLKMFLNSVDCDRPRLPSIDMALARLRCSMKLSPRCLVSPFSAVSPTSSRHSEPPMMPHCRDKRSCKAQDCHHQAKSGGYCISHGGGRRCKVEGCMRHPKGRGLCIAHGGKIRCSVEGCDKHAKAGGKCISHGGGRKCSVPECPRHAVGSGLCISHGGGRRCKVINCSRAARSFGLCWTHGGKHLCTIDGCQKGGNFKNDRCSTHADWP